MKPVRSLVVLFALILSSCAPEPVPAAPLLEPTGTIPASPSPTKEASTATSLPSPRPTPLPTDTATPAIPAYLDSDGPLAAVACNESAYVSDVTVEDGAILSPGQIFTKTWKLKNIGTCTWRKAYSMTFVSGDDMQGSDTEIRKPVGPGQMTEISLSLIAPDTEGTYTGYWTLADKTGTPFGEKVYVQILVSDDVATDIATPTQTSTLTPTPISEETPSSVPTTIPGS